MMGEIYVLNRCARLLQKRSYLERMCLLFLFQARRKTSLPSDRRSVPCGTASSKAKGYERTTIYALVTGTLWKAIVTKRSQPLWTAYIRWHASASFRPAVLNALPCSSWNFIG
jgi:hypothetical protein